MKNDHFSNAKRKYQSIEFEVTADDLEQGKRNLSDTTSCPIGRALYRWAKHNKVKLKSHAIFNSFFIANTKAGLFLYHFDNDTANWFNAMYDGEEVSPTTVRFNLNEEYKIAD